MLVLLGGACWHYAYYHGMLERPVEMTIHGVQESTENYEISVAYPQFGIREFDSQIRQVIDGRIGEIKRLSIPSSAAGYKNTLEISFTEPYIGDDYVSARLNVSHYTGGAHGITITTGLNWDRKRKKVAKLDDAIALTGQSLQSIAYGARLALESDLGSIYVEGIQPSRENFGSFVIDKNYVTFIFQPYQVAAYAAGPQEVSFVRMN